MKTLRTILATSLLVALSVNSNAQSWSNATYGVTLSPPANAGIGDVPVSYAKLLLHYNRTTLSPPYTSIYGLHSVMEDLALSSNNTQPMYGAYFKNTRKTVGSGGPPPSNELYGIYIDNDFQSAGTTWGIRLKNERLSGGPGSSYGIQSINNDPTTNGSAIYGIHTSNTKALTGNVYGIYSTNVGNCNTQGHSVYGAYLSAQNTNSGGNASVYGLYSIVSGGTESKRWAGYFTGGHVAVMNGNLGIGTATPSEKLHVTGGNAVIVGNVGIGTTTIDNAQGWQRAMDVYGLESSKLLVRTNTVKTGIFSHNTWNGTVGRIGTESAHDLRLTAGYLNDVMTLKTNGNVGIGTTTPNAKLDVNGNINVNGNLALEDIILGKGSKQFILHTQMQFPNNPPILHIAPKKSDNSDFDWDKQITFKHDGNVGIGGANPSQALTVQGKIAVYPQGITSDEKYHGNLIITKPAGSGQYINLIRQDSYPWSIGTVYNNNNFAIGAGKITDSEFTAPFFTIGTNGSVGIGIATPSTTYKLDVKGAIRACDLRIEVAQGCDYVFADDYNLMSLSELNDFVKTNRHLPEVAPAIQMESEGINMSEMSTLLLKKIEELTLYVIELEKKNNVLESRLDALAK